MRSNLFINKNNRWKGELMMFVIGTIGKVRGHRLTVKRRKFKEWFVLRICSSILQDCRFLVYFKCSLILV